MKEIIRINRLSFAYEKKPVLKELEFSLPQGSFTGIIGPNGAGKTTLLKNILGLVDLSPGRIFIKQKDILNYKFGEIAREMTYVKQRLEESALSVFDYILTGRTPYLSRYQLFESREDIEIAKKYLKLLNLEKYADKNLDQLSGGERQMVQLARALGQETPIMLLDEPTSHLDISHKIEIMNMLSDIHDRLNKTILIVLHDLNLAGEYCDNLILMDQGKIHSMGKPQDVLTYQNIEKVFDTLVIVKENPLSGKPYVIPVTRGMQKTDQQ